MNGRRGKAVFLIAQQLSLSSCAVKLHPPAFVCSNGPPIAKPLAKGGAACPCRQQSTCTTFCTGTCRTEGDAGKRDTRERETNENINQERDTDDRSEIGTMAPHLPDRPQERDPGEFLPWLPCTLALDLPVVNFTVGDLLSLTNGSIVETAYHQSSDLPLRVNGQLVGWTEFEVVGERLAVRLTDLS